MYQFAGLLGSMAIALTGWPVKSPETSIQVTPRSVVRTMWELALYPENVQSAPSTSVGSARILVSPPAGLIPAFRNVVACVQLFPLFCV
jgi:hypothetical protein